MHQQLLSVWTESGKESAQGHNISPYKCIEKLYGFPLGTAYRILCSVQDDDDYDDEYSLLSKCNIGCICPMTSNQPVFIQMTPFPSIVRRMNSFKFLNGVLIKLADMWYVEMILSSDT